MTRLWKTAHLAVFTCTAALFLATPSAADELTMPKESAESSVSITLPGRGMSMTQVEDRFGTPQQKLPEVGDPPIIRWIYPDFTVYFEYQYVIDAVSNVVGPPPTATQETMQPEENANGTESTEQEQPPKPDALMPPAADDSAPANP